MPMFRQLRRTLPLQPSDYYRRNCFLGASFLDENAAAARHAIGVGKLLWGSDYPHIEGTWPHTKQRLQQVFAGVPRDEVARMLGGNAAEVYGFDASALAAVAARVGPARDSIGA
jgi:predicted TIM-barrel fold metal-dependent hydrolase